MFKGCAGAASGGGTPCHRRGCKGVAVARVFEKDTRCETDGKKAVSSDGVRVAATPGSS